MKLEQIPEGDRVPYKKDCSCCGMPCGLLTQPDDSPEYYTGVYVQCSCGEYIEFVLPVN